MELTIEVQPQGTLAAEPFCGRGVGGQDSHSVRVGTVEVTVHLLLSVAWAPGPPTSVLVLAGPSLSLRYDDWMAGVTREVRRAVCHPGIRFSI